MLNTRLDAIHSKSNFAITLIQPTLRPPFQRAEQSELEESTESNDVSRSFLCFALLCFQATSRTRKIDISVVAVLKSKSWAVTVSRTIPQWLATGPGGRCALRASQQNRLHCRRVSINVKKRRRMLFAPVCKKLPPSVSALSTSVRTRSETFTERSSVNAWKPIMVVFQISSFSLRWRNVIGPICDVIPDKIKSNRTSIQILVRTNELLSRCARKQSTAAR